MEKKSSRVKISLSGTESRHCRGGSKIQPVQNYVFRLLAHHRTLGKRFLPCLVPSFPPPPRGEAALNSTAVLFPFFQHYGAGVGKKKRDDVGWVLSNTMHAALPKEWHFNSTGKVLIERPDLTR